MKVGLLVDDAEVEIIRSRIERQPWALGAFRRLKSTADAVFGWRGGTVGSTPRGSASAVEAAGRLQASLAVVHASLHWAPQSW